MPCVADRPTFSERLRSVGKATWGTAVDRPCLTAITFFVIFALFPSGHVAAVNAAHCGAVN